MVTRRNSDRKYRNKGKEERKKKETKKMRATVIPIYASNNVREGRRGNGREDATLCVPESLNYAHLNRPGRREGRRTMLESVWW